MPRTILSTGNVLLDRELDDLRAEIERLRSRLGTAESSAEVQPAAASAGVEAIGIDGAQGLQGNVVLDGGDGIALSQFGQTIQVDADMCDSAPEDVGYSRASTTYDEFSEVVSDLASHTMDTGETYTRLIEYGGVFPQAMSVDSIGARAAPGVAGYTDYYWVGRDFGTEFSQHVVVQPGYTVPWEKNAWGSVSLLARVGTSGYDMYEAVWVEDDSLGIRFQVILRKIVSGTLSTISQVRGFRVPQANDVFRFSVSPGSQRVYVNGALVLYGNDTSLLPTRAGFRTGGISYADPYYPIHVTYYEIQSKRRRVGGYSGTSLELSRCDHVHDGVSAVRVGYEHGTGLMEVQGDMHIDIDGGIDATVDPDNGYLSVRNAWRRSFLLG